MCSHERIFFPLLFCSSTFFFPRPRCGIISAYYTYIFFRSFYHSINYTFITNRNRFRLFFSLFPRVSLTVFFQNGLFFFFFFFFAPSGPVSRRCPRSPLAAFNFTRLSTLYYYTIILIYLPNYLLGPAREYPHGARVRFRSHDPRPAHVVG